MSSWSSLSDWLRLGCKGHGVQDAWQQLAFCWLDSTCLAVMVAAISSCIAVARRLQAIDEHARREIRFGRTVRMCLSGAIVCGSVSFGLALLGGSIWPGQLKPVAGVTVLIAVAVDWSTQSASDWLRSILIGLAKTYLAKDGFDVDLMQQRASSPADKSER